MESGSLAWQSRPCVSWFLSLQFQHPQNFPDFTILPMLRHWQHPTWTKSLAVLYLCSLHTISSAYMPHLGTPRELLFILPNLAQKYPLHAVFPAPLHGVTCSLFGNCLQFPIHTSRRARMWSTLLIISLPPLLEGESRQGFSAWWPLRLCTYIRWHWNAAWASEQQHLSIRHGRAGLQASYATKSHFWLLTLLVSVP